MDKLDTLGKYEPFGYFQLRNLPPWRRKAISLTHHWLFLTVVHATIVFAAGQLAWPYVSFPNLSLDSTIDGDRFDAKLTINTVSDIFVLLVFTLEAVFKILAFGSGLNWKNFSKSRGSNKEQDDLGEHDLENEPSLQVEKLRPEEEAAILEVFNLFDVDHSGTMNQIELRLAMRGLGFDESSESLKRLFEEMDSDGNQEIDFEEFKAVMAAKIYSQKPPPGYFQLKWNQFDFAILCISWFVLPIQFSVPNAKRVGDIARLIRLARLWVVLQSRALRGLQDVLVVVSLSLQTSAQILLLVASVLLIYAIMGISLFGDGSYHPKCVVDDVSPNVSFTTAQAAAAALAARRQGSGGAVYDAWAQALAPPRPAGELMQPLRPCGSEPCQAGFRCACAGRPAGGSGGRVSPPAAGADVGCGRMPMSPLGATSGNRPVTADYGFTGFDNVLQGFLTAIISTTQA